MTTASATRGLVNPSRATGDETTAASTSSGQAGLHNAFGWGPRLAATGVTFDVIAVDVPLGQAALRLLRGRDVPLGPVILDHRWRRIGFLVPPQRDEPVPEVELRRGPRQVGVGAWVVLPTGDQNTMVTWLQPPAAGDHLTPTGIVREALREAATTLGTDKSRT
ncbi:hypothetical protein [Embleya scabrispora]|uniref:hypothetical protein n=1 Tax=Embleya scabrispora TaxID=159449 RepID=UPI00039C0C59|nr:hypothetical protein [Embleya scabrispora]MYS80340.1 hypothetical protein [Streptomyces sp. SID5474]